MGGTTKPNFDGVGNTLPSMLDSPPTMAITVNVEDEVPAPVVTTTGAADAGTPTGTDVVIKFALLVVMVAATPPIVTVAPVRPVPAIVTTVPTVPVLGVSELIDGIAGGGATLTINGALEVPILVVTATVPTPGFALLGTLVIICIPLLFPALAITPPIMTVAPPKLVPNIVTGAFGVPLATDRLDMLGGCDGGGGGGVIMTVVPHPPVLILMLPFPNVTVAAAQAAPLTLTVCA